MQNLDNAKKLRIRYKNWRGEVSIRNIEPRGLWFGSSEWHPEQQWFIQALDLDKNGIRDFALRDMEIVASTT